MRRITPTVLYTKVDGQCDKLATVVGRTMLTKLVTIRAQGLRHSSIAKYNTMYGKPRMIASVPKTSSIRSAVSIEHRLVKDTQTHIEVRDTGHIKYAGKKAIVDSSLCPSEQLTMSTSGLYRSAKFGWSLGCYVCRVLYPLRNTHVWPLRESVALSTKPEVRNTSQCRHRRIKPRP